MTQRRPLASDPDPLRHPQSAGRASLAPWRRRRGFGLVDVLVALGLAAFAAALAAQTMSTTRRVWERTETESGRLADAALFLVRWRALVENAGANGAAGGGVVGDERRLTLAVRSPAYPDPPGWDIVWLRADNVGAEATAEALRWGRRRIASRAEAAAILAVERAQLDAAPALQDAPPAAFDRPLWRGDARWRLRYYGADHPGAAPMWWRSWPPHTVRTGAAPGAGAPLLLALLRAEDAAAPANAAWFAAPVSRLASLCAAAPNDLACRLDPSAATPTPRGAP